MNKLKITRVIISISVYAVFTLAFLGAIPPASAITEILIHTQLVPAFIKGFMSGFLAAAAGFIAVIALTFFFGRVYCSSLCPLGTLQDFFIFLRYKLRKRKPFKPGRNHRWFRYPFIGIMLVLFFAGNVTLLDVHEPFSNFGRVTNEVIKPAFFSMNNALAGALNRISVSAIRKADMREAYLPALGHSIVILVFLGMLSFFKGRFFCNTLCPSGALLGLISGFSFFKIRISREKCTSCGLCEGVCKAECIDLAGGKIDHERCINCFNCIDACKNGSLKYTAQAKPAKTDGERRNFIKTAFTGIMAAAVLSLPGRILAGETAIKKRNPIVMPPGAKSTENFGGRCIACYICVASCPSKVIAPTMFERGLDKLLQPRLDYDKSYCNYRCNICTLVCPTGAIMPLTIGEKKLMKIGGAKFIKENCIVQTKKQECLVCNEYCPTKACSLVPYENGLKIPKVLDNLCIGCGACENRCPAMPKKAIYVEGLSIHKKADKPSDKAKKWTGGKEFPF
jgi:polyferredoxin